MQHIGHLRTIRDDELELMRSWRNAPSVRANMYTRHEIGADEHLAWWSRVAQRPDVRCFMHELAGQPSGIVSFTHIDTVNANAAWAFYAAPDAARGTGSMMEYLALEHAFGPLALHKLHCEVLAFNTPVVRLHEKFGFKVEGVRREQHRVDSGFVDIVELGLLAAEWAVQRPAMAAKIQSFAPRS
jgi:UDP-4-amino-4,6-dideoxy-N-acetyl-beta-L-altrosamine N-acetyltransferase